MHNIDQIPKQSLHGSSWLQRIVSLQGWREQHYGSASICVSKVTSAQQERALASGHCEQQQVDTQVNSLPVAI